MKDVVQVTVRQGRPLPLALVFLANPTRAAGASVSLRSAPLAVDSLLVHQLRSLIGQELRASFAVHPCLHVPCDLHSLGMMLFTTLAANAEQTPLAVAAAVRELSDGVARFAREHTGAAAEAIADWAVNRLRQAEADGVLARRQVFHEPAAHAEEGDQVPESFWYEALLLGLRALTQIPEFGFCRGHDDFDPQHPEGPVDHLRAELQVLAHNIDAELLGMRGKQEEIAEAVGRLRAALDAPPADDARRRSGP